MRLLSVRNQQTFRGVYWHIHLDIISYNGLLYFIFHAGIFRPLLLGLILMWSCSYFICCFRYSSLTSWSCTHLICCFWSSLQEVMWLCKRLERCFKNSEVIVLVFHMLLQVLFTNIVVAYAFLMLLHILFTNNMMVYPFAVSREENYSWCCIIRLLHDVLFSMMHLPALTETPSLGGSETLCG